MSRRVVITGLGAITPIGNSVDDFYAGIKEGRIGLDNISKFDASDFRVKIAAEVKDFAPENYMDKKAARRMEPFCQYAVAAAGEAIKDSGLDIEKEDPFMVGCAIASGVGSLQLFEKEHTRQLEKGGDKVAPLFIPMFISNMAAGNVSITYGLKGKNINVVTACASGTNSVGEAFRTIRYGDADVMLAGGSEASITPMGIAGFSSLNALSVSEDKSRCSIPFDKDRNGFVMGEGAAILVLEELEHARKRGAKIYAEVVGYGCSADAYHITSPDETGEGAARAMLNACNDAGVSTDDIDYINAHGTSTHHNDLFETKAIKLTFGEHAYDIMINSTKSMIGHLLGAAGAIELVTCAKELEDGFVHATVGLKETEEEMDLDYCKESRNADIQYALSNSFGFGGHNACVLLKKWS